MFLVVLRAPISFLMVLSVKGLNHEREIIGILFQLSIYIDTITWAGCSMIPEFYQTIAYTFALE